MYKICQDRSEELRELVGRHRAAGGGVYMWTSTLPHDAGDELQPMRHHIAEAWQKMQTGNAYKRLKAMVGIVGTVRALEVTNGPSGWHPHLHILFLTDKPLEDRATGVVGRDGQRFVQAMKRRWTRRVTARNKETGKAYRPPSHEHGVTFLPCHKDEYITKMGLADELTRGSWKKSREVAGYRTPIQILANIAAARDTKSEPSKRDVALWTEYADAMKGAKQLTWSRGLRRRYNLAPEQSDLELLEREENDASAVVMYTIADNVWDRYFRNNWRARCAVLVGADRDGWDGIQRVIDRLRGLEPVPF
jgi:hypothetical protein